MLIPTLHPAYALRGGGEPLAQMRADFVRAKQALAAGMIGPVITLLRGPLGRPTRQALAAALAELVAARAT